MRTNYRSEIIADVAEQLHSYGYTVYLAQSKTYGFYTDGLRCVSFAYDLQLKFSGNYKSTRSGTGWGMDHDTVGISEDQARAKIAANAPSWATHENVRYTTPQQQLETYGASSGYTVYAPDTTNS